MSNPRERTPWGIGANVFECNIVTLQLIIIPIFVGAFDPVIKGLAKWLEDLKIKGRVETIQTTALLRSVRILRRVQET